LSLYDYDDLHAVLLRSLITVPSLVLRQSQPPPNIPAYNIALRSRGFGLAPVRLERLLQHACVEEAIWEKGMNQLSEKKW